MKNNDIPIGSLLYDRTMNDYGLVIKCDWSVHKNTSFKYYLIHWQKSHLFNINKEINYKWAAAQLYYRVELGEIILFKNEKK